jgi:hypothetical protein
MNDFRNTMMTMMRKVWANPFARNIILFIMSVELLVLIIVLFILVLFYGTMLLSKYGVEIAVGFFIIMVGMVLFLILSEIRRELFKVIDKYLKTEKKDE